MMYYYIYWSNPYLGTFFCFFQFSKQKPYFVSEKDSLGEAPKYSVRPDVAAHRKRYVQAKQRVQRSPQTGKDIDSNTSPVNKSVTERRVVAHTSG